MSEIKATENFYKYGSSMGQKYLCELCVCMCLGREPARGAGEAGGVLGVTGPPPPPPQECQL